MLNAITSTARNVINAILDRTITILEFLYTLSVETATTVCAILLVLVILSLVALAIQFVITFIYLYYIGPDATPTALLRIYPGLSKWKRWGNTDETSKL